MKPFKPKDSIFSPPGENDANTAVKNSDSDDEEDDYMKMTFTDDATTTTKSHPETSLQRRLREKREAEARSRPKSKAEIAAEIEARRESALSKSLLSADPAEIKKNKGLAMMAKMGFKGGALGSKTNADARAEPIRVMVKDGREGIGLESERKRKLREAAERAREQAKKHRLDENEYRERVRLEREEARLEKQLAAAQRIAERMDDEAGDDAPGQPRSSSLSKGKGTDDNGDDNGQKQDEEGKNPAKKKGSVSSRPLRSLPVIYRGIVRAREERERDRRMRYDLEQGSNIGSDNLSRLPTYIDEDLDADDKHALGKTLDPKELYVTADDLEEEDEELAEFEALKRAERLERVVLYLRERHRYCFWCKFAYPDEEMEGCPGLKEEDHD
ncbi:putative g-patch domain protein [Naviculisporaceae sp. PSN 640]